MPRPIPPPLPALRRMRALGDWLNQLRENVESLQPVPSLNVLTAHTAIGVTREAAPGSETQPAAASSVQRFIVTAVLGDYVECRKANELGNAIPASELYYVAKPHPLRQTTTDTLTINNFRVTFTDTNRRRQTFTGATIPQGFVNGSFIDEILDPPYIVGDSEIFATEPVGKTGAFRYPTPQTPERLTWLDLNISARRWVAIRTLVDICRIENSVPTTRRIILDGGAIH